jgi:hypothetical protein
MRYRQGAQRHRRELGLENFSDGFNEDGGRGYYGPDFDDEPEDVPGRWDDTRGF